MMLLASVKKHSLLTLPHQIPLNLRKYLLHSSSMTQKMRRLSTHPITVKIINQSWQHLTLTNAKILNLESRTRCLVREVMIYSGEEQWMSACSVFPYCTFEGKTKYLLHMLDERPLGDLLYSQKDLTRTPFTILQDKSTEKEGIWTRQSVFYFKKKPILLTETFLPQLIKALLNKTLK